jgi:hypothetical protein
VAAVGPTLAALPVTPTLARNARATTAALWTYCDANARGCGGGGACVREQVRLYEEVAAAAALVDAGRLLAAHNTPMPMRFLQTCDAAGACGVIKRLLQRTARQTPPPTEAGWAALWAALRQLHATAFHHVELPWMLAELCRALLRCGCVSWVCLCACCFAFVLWRSVDLIVCAMGGAIKQAIWWRLL